LPWEKRRGSCQVLEGGPRKKGGQAVVFTRQAPSALNFLLQSVFGECELFLQYGDLVLRFSVACPHETAVIAVRPLLSDAAVTVRIFRASAET